MATLVAAAAYADSEPPAPDIAEVRPVMVPTQAGRLAVYAVGTGEQTLILWPSIFADRTIYRRIIPELAQRYRVIVVEGPGHGLSEQQPRNAGINEHVGALGEVMDHLGINRAAIIGTSWGGMIAGHFAVDHPERVEGLALLNTPFYLGQGRPRLGNRMIVFGARMMLRRNLYINGVARSFLTEETREQNDEAMASFSAHLKNADRRGLVRAVRSVLLTDVPLAPRLKSISVPTLVVAGTFDEMYPLEDMRRAATQIPRATFATLETAHISVVDDPEGTLELLLPFLEGLGE
jgi:pimeloyl-ACP methyl ester carboxylesterase